MPATPTATGPTEYSPEEQIIMARFLTRIRRATRRSVETVSHGAFAVL
jgi:hypothetical protein